MQASEVQAVAPASHLTAVSSPAFWRRKLLWIFLIGFLLRVSVILVGHTYKTMRLEGTFSYGWEMGRIAASLAQGHGFSSPFQKPTGPTAWEPPAYPFLMAGVYKICGIYTPLAAFLLLTINSFFSALTSIPIFYLARRSFGWKVAKWSAWSWALFPYAMYWAIKWIWETSITLCLLTTLILMAMRLAEGRRRGEWMGWGALWGLGALLNPAILSLLPFAGLWIVFRLAGDRKPWLTRAAVAAIVFWLCITPWLLRNDRTFGQPVFLRTNFGAEFRMGNGPGANGTWMSYLHPSHNVVEFAKYRKLGEVAYVAMRKREALDWIRANPGQFVKVTVYRMVYYWTGVPWGSLIMPLKNWLFLASSLVAWFGTYLMWKQRRPGWFLYAAAMLVYPLVYYIVFPHPRYRAPIEPLIDILIVFVLAQSSTLEKRHPDLEDGCQDHGQ